MSGEVVGVSERNQSVQDHSCTYTMVILYAHIYTYYIIYIICAIEVVYDNNIDNYNVTIYATPMFIIRIGGAVVITIVGTG